MSKPASSKLPRKSSNGNKPKGSLRESRIKKAGKYLMKIVIGLLFMGILVFLLSPLIIYLLYRQQVYTDVDKVAPNEVAIVFGAGVYKDGSPTPVLYDRLHTAHKLYTQNKVTKILVSGDNRTEDYNEPENMRNFLIELGVPPNDVVRDFAGRRTYDTCYRARHIFKVDEAVLISQGFHLPRAIFLCEQMGIESSGIYSNQQDYLAMPYYELREILALYKGILDVLIIHPVPVMGDPEPISWLIK